MSVVQYMRDGALDSRLIEQYRGQCTGEALRDLEGAEACLDGFLYMSRGIATSETDRTAAV
jgi:hypothetical protein